MAIVVRKIGSDIMVYWFPAEDVDEWLTAAVLEYLETAPGPDAVEIARLVESDLGRRPNVGAAFQKYLDQPVSLSPDERTMLEVVVAKLREGREEN